MADEPESRERNVVSMLRGLTLVIAVTGVLAVLLDNRYAVFVGAFLVPSTWVFWRPRWGQIVAWIMWCVPLVMLALLLLIGHMHQLRTPSAWLSGVAVLLAVVGLPLVRRLHRAPRMPRNTRLPQARVIRGR